MSERALCWRVFCWVRSVTKLCYRSPTPIITCERSDFLIADGAKNWGLVSSLACPIFYGACPARRPDLPAKTMFYHIGMHTHQRLDSKAVLLDWVGLVRSWGWGWGWAFGCVGLGSVGLKGDGFKEQYLVHLY